MNGAKTHGEILAAIKKQSFSVRVAFFDYLDRFTWKVVNGEKVKLKWPEALVVIDLSEWNMAYNAAIRDAQNDAMLLAQQLAEVGKSEGTK